VRTALITGVTGQDGSYLAELLLEKGYEVHGIIRRCSTFNTSRIDHLYQDPHDADARLFLHYGDLTDASRLVTLLERVHPGEVYHLAAQSHVRVSFDRLDSPLAYGYAARTHVFRQNFPLYDSPRRWLRMAYCTTCLDGPEDRSTVILEWGDREGAPFVVSGQAWGENRLIGRPAILDMPVGRGHVVAFNFNPLHRDLNRGDHRLVWNAILNWQAILAGKPDRPAAEGH